MVGKSGCNEKGCRYPRASDVAKCCTLQVLSQILHDTESAKDKILDANPYLKRRMSIHPSAERILTESNVIQEDKHYSNYS